MVRSFLSFLFLLLIVPPAPMLGFAQDTEGIRVIRIKVEQYSMGKKALPFERVAREILETIGVRVVGSAAADADADLLISARGQALHQSYATIGDRYTGATIQGTISLDSIATAKTIHQADFNYTKPTSLFSWRGAPLTENTAPFLSAFWGEKWGGSQTEPESGVGASFPQTIIEMIAAIWGKEKIAEPLCAQEPRIRVVTAIFLAKLRSRDSVPPLILLLQAKDEDVRVAGAWALGQIGDPSAVEALIKAMDDTSLPVRASAADALGKIKDSRAIDPLIAAIKKRDCENTYEVCHIAKALGELGTSHAAETLIESFRSYIEREEAKGSKGLESCYVVETARALAKLGNHRSVPLLEATLSKEGLLGSANRNEIKKALSMLR